MKKIIFLIALSTFAACNSKVQNGNSLTEDERAYLRAQAAAKCLEESAKDFEDFKSISSANMLAYVRDRSWNIAYKLGDTVQQTYKLVVWKVDATNVYFRLNIPEDGITVNKFIKINTAINTDMIVNLQTKKCAKTLTFAQSSSSGSATIDSGNVRQDSTSLENTVSKYNFNFQFPALFGYLDRTQTRKVLNNDLVVTTTEETSYTITENTTPIVQDSPYTAYSNRKFCMFRNTNAVPNDLYAFPYDLVCTAVNAATGVDADGDAVVDFNLTEL